MSDNIHDPRHDALDSMRLAVLAVKFLEAKEQKPKTRFLWFSKGKLLLFLEGNKGAKDEV